MEELVRSLIEILNQETNHYRNLAVLADKQRELLVAGKIEVLPENLRLEEKEVFALSPLVAGRKDLLAKIAKPNHVKTMSLGEALEKSPANQAGELKRAIIELTRSAKKLEEINQINEKLLGNALSEVNFTIKLIRSGGKAKTLAAVRTSEEKKSSFVNRVV
jgi:flagellar biosynthesis/type III secretory pathway chaperone